MNFFYVFFIGLLLSLWWLISYRTFMFGNLS